MPKAKSIRVRISGQVQGVFFRVWAKQRADRLGVFGWIRNRLDGDVEGLFVGSEEGVMELLRVCGKGPEGAIVDEVRVELALGITSASFKIKPTV